MMNIKLLSHNTALLKNSIIKFCIYWSTNKKNSSRELVKFWSSVYNY